ncbi:MAG: competence protein ComEC [Glaciecola sp.]|jgi:competence protein ComEC
MAIVAVFALLCLHFRTKTWISGAIVGFLWASSVGHWYSSWQLPNRYFNENIVVEGVVSTLQIQLNNKTKINTVEDTLVYDKNSLKSVEQKSFILQLNKIGTTKLIHSPKIRLSWFEPSLILKQGDTLKLLVNIKRPHAIGNEHGFNRQKWLASLNIVGVGNVKTSPSNLRLEANTNLRQRLSDQLLKYATQVELPNIRWILALSLGERSLFEDDDWKLLQTTGTAHLFAISGLHLGIVSLMFFQLAKLALFLANTYICQNKQTKIGPLALAVSVPFCIFYAYLSGFQIPVNRSLIALLFLAILLLYQVHWRASTILLHLIVCFFLLFPLSILGMSFWFSFGAIFSICFFVWRYPVRRHSALNTFKQTVGLQLFLTVLMIPLIALNFGVLSTVSAIVNLIVMPVVSLILIPLCLFVVISMILQIHALNRNLLQLIDWCFEQLILCMKVFASGENASVDVNIVGPAVWLILLLILILLFLPYWPHRKKVICTLFLVILAQSFAENKQSNGWMLRVFDVGQGLSVLVKHNNRFLIYDTAQSFRNGSSYAQSVIAPYFENEHNYSQLNLAEENVPSIDYLINSHMDNDHAGGNSFLFNRYNVSQWLSPVKGCTTQDSFLWGQLEVDVLWPTKEVSGDDNNHSCVIKISGGSFSVLLTGDIEKEAEKAIINLYANSNILEADILVAPHHGSKTSSTLPFMQAVSPRYVVVSSKYYNQWGFPHPHVEANYKSVNASVFNTAYDGEVVFEFADGKLSSRTYRQALWSPWYMHVKKNDY